MTTDPSQMGAWVQAEGVTYRFQGPGTGTARDFDAVLSSPTWGAVVDLSALRSSLHMSPHPLEVRECPWWGLKMASKRSLSLPEGLGLELRLLGLAASTIALEGHSTSLCLTI